MGKIKLICDSMADLTKEQIESLVKTGKISDDLDAEELSKLRELAKEKKIKGYTKMTKEELKEALNDE